MKFTKIIKASKNISTNELLSLIKSQIGEEFKAMWTFAWDTNDIASARKTTINRGKGSEDAILIKNSSGVSAIYIAPFKLENKPTDDTMLLFECDDAWFFDL